MNLELSAIQTTNWQKLHIESYRTTAFGGRVGFECADHGAFALANTAQISENAKFIK